MRFRYPAKTNDAKDLVLASFLLLSSNDRWKTATNVVQSQPTTFKAGQKYAIVGKVAQASQHYSVC